MTYAIEACGTSGICRIGRMCRCLPRAGDRKRDAHREYESIARTWFATQARVRLRPKDRRIPFDESTTIRSRQETSGPATVSLFDAAGRLVRRLTSDIQSPGYHSLTWDGRDDQGRRLPAGVYVTRIETTEGVTAWRVVLAK